MKKLFILYSIISVLTSCSESGRFVHYDTGLLIDTSKGIICTPKNLGEKYKKGLISQSTYSGTGLFTELKDCTN